MPIEPARLGFTPDGVPRSDVYDDIYYSGDGGPEQARHVFLAGNGLPARWQERRQFVIVETGFGLGLNFLTTWAAWRNDPRRCERLHFVSCELHPFGRDNLARLHERWPELAAPAAELRASWPELTPGMHRLHFDNDQVTLTLYLGDAVEGIESLAARADAFYLDGFAPGRNPRMWSARLLHSLSRLAAPGATLATWSVAGEVREGLRRAGFETEKTPGFGSKREMLRGRMASGDSAASPAAAAERRTLVIGAGAAGASITERLAARGWTVQLIDAASSPGQGASGNHAGAFRPVPNIHENRMARLTRAGALYGLRHLARLAAAGLPVRWAPSGVLHQAKDAAQEKTMRETVERHRPPPGYLRFADAEEASRLAGWPLPFGGWWFPACGWIQPSSLCAANAAAHPGRVAHHFGRHAARLERSDGEWRAFDRDGGLIAAAPVAIIAGGTGSLGFPQMAAVPIIVTRGQVSHLAAENGSAPQIVVCRLGYVTPAVDGLRCTGATFAVDDDDATLREADHAKNFARLDGMLPGYPATLAAAQPGRTAFRPATSDRLPMVGAVPLALPDGASLPRNTPLSQIPRHPGLYTVSGFGARGLVWASLMGEALASALDGDPLPLERDLWEAVDPARYLLQPVRGSALHAEE